MLALMFAALIGCKLRLQRGERNLFAKYIAKQTIDNKNCTTAATGKGISPSMLAIFNQTIL